MKFAVKAVILSLLTVACIITTVVLWFQMNGQDVEFEKVNVTVVSSETITHRVLKGSSTKTQYEEYAVKVRYQGEVYSLENCHNSYSYREGQTVTAYLANGRLFANEEGVNTSTPVATAYFVFLILSFVMVIGVPCYLASPKSRAA